jgi:hypothetical protein
MYLADKELSKENSKQVISNEVLQILINELKGRTHDKRFTFSAYRNQYDVAYHGKTIARGTL